MQAASPLKVSKYTVDVDVRNVLGLEERVQVYLADTLDALGRAERLQDVLIDRRFIPVRSEGRLEMLSTAHIAWMRVALIVAIDELDLAAEGDEESVVAPVRVELDDGSSLEGAFRYAMPIGNRRLVDFLADLPDWVPLRDGDWLYLIGRERIVRVIPREVT